MKKIIIIVFVLLIIQEFCYLIKGTLNIVNNNNSIKEVKKIERMIQ